jgi:hypothetical protein
MPVFLVYFKLATDSDTANITPLANLFIM